MVLFVSTQYMCAVHGIYYSSCGVDAGTKRVSVLFFICFSFLPLLLPPILGPLPL